MFLKILFYSSLFVIVQSYQGQRDYNDLPCLSAGGLCVRTSECPEGKRAATRGLCPLRQQEGFECCYGVSTKETRCRQNGGECMPKSEPCRPELVYSRASNCAADEKCCILVK